ncbi:MAG: radical SAM protein [Candidatus Helarchaeota archaeon]|nr:radical SAM protein [Candidatus Helarchaeota archaeon]
MFKFFKKKELERPLCKICGKNELLVSKKLGVCLDCILHKSEDALKLTSQLHIASRKPYNLPGAPPQSSNGLKCGLCVNDCKIGENEVGYCGLVINRDKKLIRNAGTPEIGLLDWYYDPLPTNCCAFICPAYGHGYPKFAYKDGPEHGYANLAVFYGACGFNCLFCQNAQYREMPQRLEPLISAKDLVSKAHKRVSCICYFGGDPGPQMLHSLAVSKLASQMAEREKRILRICWETNGGMNWPLLERAVGYALKSGGTVKIDLKTFHESLNIALCGVTNRQTLDNFKRIKPFIQERPEIPLLFATTLLVPGYVDLEEVQQIASFIADLDPTIPYSLLGFYPHFFLNDLPTTSKEHADRCLKAAKAEGLTRVKIGNVHLLSNADY